MEATEPRFGALRPIYDSMRRRKTVSNSVDLRLRTSDLGLRPELHASSPELVPFPRSLEALSLKSKVRRPRSGVRC